MARFGTKYDRLDTRVYEIIDPTVMTDQIGYLSAKDYFERVLAGVPSSSLYNPYDFDADGTDKDFDDDLVNSELDAPEMAMETDIKISELKDKVRSENQKNDSASYPPREAETRPTDSAESKEP